MRIGVLGLRGFPSNYSGIECVALDLYPGLASKGHQIVILSPNDATVPLPENIRIVKIPHIRYQPLQSITYAFIGIYSLWRNFRCDVVHLHGLAYGLVSWLAKLMGFRVVSTVHGLDWKRKRWHGMGSRLILLGEKLMIRYSDEIIVVSQELHDYFLSKYNVYTHLIYNASNIGARSEINNKTQHAVVVPNQEYFLYGGRLVPEKRVEDVITAFKYWKGNELLLISGTGPRFYTKKLNRLAIDTQKIKFLGHLDPANLHLLIRNAKVCITASELEGFSIALLEYILTGRPTIASNIAPHEELFSILADRTLLFELGNVNALLHRLTQVTENYEAYKHKAERLRDSAAKEFDVDRMVLKTEAVLMKISETI